jgi:magnesium chelatase subunit I
VAAADLARLVEEVAPLREAVGQLTGGDESPAVLASAVELVLEGLHLSKRLNKDTLAGGKATYRSRG